MLNNFIKYFIVVVIFVCLISCKQNETYYQFAFIPKNEWAKNNEICFSLDSISVNPLHKYTVSVEITHNIGYAYKNLWLYLDQTLQDTIPIRDTLNCTIIDDNGKWEGVGNGPIRQLSVLYKTNIALDTTDIQRKICIRHAMQDFQLKGIEKIGLKID